MTARALVADDDPELLHIVMLVVQQLGVEVVTASTGAELLDKLANQGPFDLIVTDVSMPRMTGLQVMHSARTAGLPAPVVVMTALRDERTAAQVAALDGAVLLQKPFTIAALRDAVGTMIRAPLTA